MATVESEKISVEDGILRINEYETEEQDVVSFFENLQDQGKDLEEWLEDILKLGVIVSKSSQVGQQIDLVEKKVQSIQNKIDEQFGDQGQVIKDAIQQLAVDMNIAQAVKAEHQKGTGKGEEFEDYCEEIISEIAKQHGDRLANTAKTPGSIPGSKKGDHLYTIEETGKKIVLEMKDYTSPMSVPKLESYMNEAMRNREAEYGIVVSKRKSGFAKHVGIFQEFDNKLFVALTTEESEDAELQKELLTVAVRWARLRLRQKSGTVDAALIIQKIESVQRNMKKFSTIKGKCTGIKDVAEEIRDDLDELNDIIKDDLKSVAESLN